MDVLVVESSASSLKLLSYIIKEMSLNVIKSQNCVDAIKIMELEYPPEIVFIGEIDSLEDGENLIKTIRLKDIQRKRYTFIVHISNCRIQGFDVDYFLKKPLDLDSLTIVIKASQRIIKQNRDLYNTQQKLEKQLKTQNEEIQKAQEIQQMLNTPVLPQTDFINLEAVYNPSNEIGGDFFNVINTPSNNLAVVMVDCTGHGLEASMYATLLKSICDRHTSLLDNPQYISTFVQMVNIDVANYILSDQFPVMFTAVYSRKDHKLYYSSANGEHPYLIRDNKAIKLAICHGMHLGYNTESQYLIKSFVTKPGDKILFFSDALVELNNAPWDRREDMVLKEKLSEEHQNLREYKDSVMEFIYNNAENTVLEDDLSLIFMQIQEPLIVPKHLIKKDEIELKLNEISEGMNKYNYIEDEIEQILVAVRELLLNAFEHGNGDRPGSTIEFEYSIWSKETKISMSDEGDGFSESEIPDPTDADRLIELFNSDNERYGHGRGIWLARKLSTTLNYSENGRSVTVTKIKKPVKTSNNYKTAIN